MSRVVRYSFEYIDNLGKKIVDQFLFQKEILFLTYLSIRNFLRLMIAPQLNAGKLISIYKITIMQIYFTGIQALPIVALMALATGSFTVLQITEKLSMLGQVDLVGKVMVAVILREIAPIFTSFVVVARSGTAIAAELGTMKVNKEIRSLQAMGIDYPSFVVFPRLLGGTLSLLCLTVSFILISFWGGYIVADLITPLPFSNYINSISSQFTYIDLIIVPMKSILTSLVVFTICCQCGLSVKKSFHEVPQVTTKAMVWSISTMVVMNISLTILMYLYLGVMNG